MKGLGGETRSQAQVGEGEDAMFRWQPQDPAAKSVGRQDRWQPVAKAMAKAAAKAVRIEQFQRSVD